MLLDIIFLVPSHPIQAYDLTSCDMSCDCSHVPLHHQIKNKKKIKRKEILNQEKYIKKKKNISVQAYHNTMPLL